MQINEFIGLASARQTVELENLDGTEIDVRPISATEWADLYDEFQMGTGENQSLQNDFDLWAALAALAVLDPVGCRAEFKQLPPPVLGEISNKILEVSGLTKQDEKKRTTEEQPGTADAVPAVPGAGGRTPVALSSHAG